MRRALTTLGVAVVAVAGVIALIGFLNSRDSATTNDRPVATPGAVAPGATGAALRAGNVELAYGPAPYGKALRRLGDSLGARDTPELRATGEAVIVRREATRAGVLARAWRHTLSVVSPQDPRLQDFIETWLGRGAAP
jgi:hypothetical protein